MFKVVHIEHEEVVDGMLYGYMHHGRKDSHAGGIDIYYVSVSSKTAEFTLRAKLNRNTVPVNFLACGYYESSRQVRGRTHFSNDIVVVLDRDLTHVDSTSVASHVDRMLEAIETCSNKSDMPINGTLVISDIEMYNTIIRALQDRMYKHYAEHTRFTIGIENMASSVDLATLCEIVNKIRQDSKYKHPGYSGNLFIGRDFVDYDPEMLWEQVLRPIINVSMKEYVVIDPSVVRRCWEACNNRLHVPQRKFLTV